MAPVHVVSPSDCEGELGLFLGRLFREGGPGTRILLRQKTVWRLESPIFHKFDDQELATEGYPLNDEEKAVLHTVGDDATAVHMGFLKRNRVRNLVIDGMEPQLGRAKTATALVFLAGQGSEDQLVEKCVMRHGRGWTACHVFDHGVRARVIDNVVGPSGHSARPDTEPAWADGISIGARDCIIAGNTVIDATDGAIVVFGSPGTLVVNNTIVARTRSALGAINLVDFGPYQGSYENTRVLSNRIYSDGAYIKLGIGIGSRPWGGDTGVGGYGGFVLDNSFGPGEFGYAMAVGGAKGFVVQGNRIDPMTIFDGQTRDGDDNPAAQPFLKFTSPDEPGGDLQPEFVEGPFRYLIGIQPGLATSKKFYASGFSLSPGPGIQLRFARLELLDEGALVLWDETEPGRILWRSHSSSKACKRPVANLTAFGVLEIRDATDQLLWTSTLGPLPSPHPDQPVSTPYMVLQETAPHLTITNSTGDLLFVSNKCFHTIPHNWSIESGHFISLSNMKPAWLVLDPKTSALVLHTSVEPLHIEEKATVWRSPNRAEVKWDGDSAHRSTAVLQGDSNLVIYAHEKGAIWATGTNGRSEDMPYIAFYGPDDPGGMRLDLLGRDMKPRWSSK